MKKKKTFLTFIIDFEWYKKISKFKIYNLYWFEWFSLCKKGFNWWNIYDKEFQDKSSTATLDKGKSFEF